MSAPEGKQDVAIEATSAERGFVVLTHDGENRVAAARGVAERSLPDAGVPFERCGFARPATARAYSRQTRTPESSSSHPASGATVWVKRGPTTGSAATV